jgi:hypothetical protein
MRLSAIRSHADRQPLRTRVLLAAVHLAAFAADRKRPTRRHIHVVVRTTNGNDYGKDLLRQHYLLHHETPR